MSRSSFSKFLKRHDGFGKQVTLTYKKSPSFQTAIGGCCTLIILTLIIYWFVVNIYYSVHDNGTFTLSSNTVLTQNEDGSWPIYTLQDYDLIVSYQFESVSGTIDSESIEDYFSAVWAQVSPE